MSYSLSLSAAKADFGDETSAVFEPILGYDAHQGGPVEVETNHHLAAVAAVVPVLAAAVGTDADHLDVSIVGHANVGHAPADGWVDEFIQVTVRVLRP